MLCVTPLRVHVSSSLHLRAAIFLCTFRCDIVFGVAVRCFLFVSFFPDCLLSFDNKIKEVNFPFVVGFSLVVVYCYYVPTQHNISDFVGSVL